MPSDFHRLNIYLQRPMFRFLRDLAHEEDTTVAAIIREVLSGERPPPVNAFATWQRAQK